MHSEVAIIGGGIIGLASAYYLKQAGVQVQLFEKGGLASAQSVGKTRIFRHLQESKEMIALAQESDLLWQTWEKASGRKLLSREGLLFKSRDFELWLQAAEESGMDYQLLDADEAAKKLPLARLTPGEYIFDPNAGSTRARRTVSFLTESLADSFIQTEVQSVIPGHPVELITPNGHYKADRLLIATGAETELAASIGITIPLNLFRHSRFTFPIKNEFAKHSLAATIDKTRQHDNHNAYTLRVGSSNLYAVGLDWGEGYSGDQDPEWVSQESLRETLDYIKAVLPGLESTPVGEVRCLFNELKILPNGKKFAAWQEDNIIVTAGVDLFKFAPLVGKLLAGSVINNEVVSSLSSPRYQTSHDPLPL